MYQPIPIYQPQPQYAPQPMMYAPQPPRRRYTKKRAAPKKRTTTTTRRKTAPVRKSTRSSGVGSAVGEMVGGGIGAAVGGAPGALIGGAIGRGAASMFKAITGFGDYKIEQNSLLCGGMSPPQIVNSTNRGGFIVRHREYLQDILSTQDFTLQSFDINPGLALSFPWLAGVAQNFEEYSLRGMVFEFKSLSSDAVLSSAASSALGVVVMATSYNVLNPDFPDKGTMENYDFANSSKPSVSFYHPIECKRRLTPVPELYIRSGGMPPNADQRLYDLGKFQIATTGMQSNDGVIGELWCTYEVELYKPKVGKEDDIIADVFDFTPGSSTQPFGTIAHPYIGNNAEGAISYSPSAGTYTFAPGLEIGTQFLVQYNNYGNTNVTIAQPTVNVGFGCQILNFYNGGTISILYSPVSGVSSSAYSCTFVIEIVHDSDNFFQFLTSAASVPNGFYALSLSVSILPDRLQHL